MVVAVAVPIVLVRRLLPLSLGVLARLVARVEVVVATRWVEGTRFGWLSVALTDVGLGALAAAVSSSIATAWQQQQRQQRQQKQQRQQRQPAHEATGARGNQRTVHIPDRSPPLTANTELACWTYT